MDASDGTPIASPVIGISLEESPPFPSVSQLIDQFSTNETGALTPSFSRFSSTGEQETVQKKAFTKWLNSHLSKKGYNLISDLYVDLRDGACLIALLDILYEAPIKPDRGHLPVHRLATVSRALSVLRERQVKLGNITAKEIVEGNDKLTLALVWGIILHWQVNHLFGSNTLPFNPNPGRPSAQPYPFFSPISSLASPLSASKSVRQAQQSNSGSSLNASTASGSGNESSSTPTPRTNTGATMSQSDLEKTLLSWCQEATRGYEAVKISNFTSSWTDGFAFNALIHHFRSDLFSYGEIFAMESPEERLRHAFDLAAKHFGIEKLLEPEDLNTPRPDKKPVLMYVMCLFQAFAPTTPSGSQSASAASSAEKTPKTPPKPGASSASKGKLPPGITSPLVGKKKSGIPIPASTGKRPQPPASPQASHIPVFSPELQKRNLTTPKKEGPESKKQCTTTSSFSPASESGPSSSKDPSAPSSFDARLLNEYHSEIEDILTWLLGAEEQLGMSVEADSARFEATISVSVEPETGEGGSVHEAVEVDKKVQHTRIMATIEGGEYAKQRFETHEDFMQVLSDYYQKIIVTFDKGQKLIYGSEGGVPKAASGQSPASKLKSPGNFGASGSSSSANSTDIESKKVIALQMQLLDDRFNQLRGKSIAHQQYLQAMLIKAQNAQLGQLRRLMTQTEGRISMIIPEEMPSDARALEKQMEEFEQLTEAMAAEQGLLNLISKFVIVDTEDMSTTTTPLSGVKENHFVDQLEALNERWHNICQITQNRGMFLQKLSNSWGEFAREEARLQDWFARLKRRLDDMEESIDELEETPIRLDTPRGELSTEKKFLEDIKKRLDRMQIDIFYGNERSSKAHASSGGHGVAVTHLDEEEADEDEPPTTPLSKITQLTHTLLGSFGESGICSKVTKSIESIRTAWETLAGRIEYCTKMVDKRLEQLELAAGQHPPEDEVDRAVPQRPKKPPRELPVIKKSSNVSSIFATMNTEEPLVKPSLVPSTGTSKTVQESKDTSPETSPVQSGQQQQLKRRKVDFCSVVGWQTMLDLISKWIEQLESSLSDLSISGEFYEPPLGHEENIESTINTSTRGALDLCKELFEGKGTVGALLERIFVSQKASNNAFIQAELEKLSLIDQELISRGKDVEELIYKGEKIIADFKLANEPYESLQEVLDSLVKRWSTLKLGLAQYQLYSTIWNLLHSMTRESSSMRHVLENYYKRFTSCAATLAEPNVEQSQLETFYQQIEFCSMTIQGQFSKLEEFNRKLGESRTETPLFFFCWPETAGTLSGTSVIWRRISIEPSSAQIEINPLQWSCFQLSAELQDLYSLWSCMSDAGRLLMEEIETAQKGAFPVKEATVVEETGDSGSSLSLSSAPGSASEGEEAAVAEESTDDDEEEDDCQTQTQKLTIAIDALTCWLKEVIQVIDEYSEEEDSDLSDAEAAEPGQPESLGSNRSKVPGSRLKCLADLAYAIDNRVEVLVDLQKTVDNEQENYAYTCRRAAEIILGSDDSVPESETLSQTESRINEFNPETLKQHSELIRAIQQLVSSHQSVLAKFRELLRQLEDISPSTTLLEADFGQISRWIEESVSFLNEGIAVGCLDTLSEQLCECERLKEYMERSVESSFTSILETAKEAVRILLGRSNTSVPVIASIQQTWLNLGTRTVSKLERLRLAQELTRKLVKSLEEHQTWLREFEIEILREGSLREVRREELLHLYAELKEDPTVEKFNWSTAIPGKLQLNKLQTKRSEYLRYILEPPDSILSQMLASFQSSSGPSNHVFDTLKKRAKIELVRAFDSLEIKLKNKVSKTEAYLQNLLRLVQLSSQETALIRRFEAVLADVGKQRKVMENAEDAALALKDLEAILLESVSGSRQARLDAIQGLLASSSNLFEFLIDSGLKGIALEQQTQVESILTDDARLRGLAEAEIEAIEEFSKVWTDFDGRACALQKWLQEYLDSGASDTGVLEAKHAELRAIESTFSQAFQTFRTARSRLETRTELIQQIFNEFNRKISRGIELPANLETQLSKMEAFLGDLGLAINEMEVTFDDEDLTSGQADDYRPEADLSLIPALLQKVIDTVCAQYEGQLGNFAEQLAALQSTFIPGPFEARFRSLETTQKALVISLAHRRNLIKQLVELCSAINTQLLALEEECDRIFTHKPDITEPEVAQMKTVSNRILADVCNLKEKLDIHCIRHSEILIGIEEVGARYDEIITEIAEQYVDVEEEEEEEEQDGGEQVLPESVRYRANNLISPNATAGHLSTITEEMATPSIVVEVAATPPIFQEAPSKTSQTPTVPEVAEKRKNPEESPIKVEKADLATIHRAINSNPYSLKPYLRKLQLLERKINAISVSTGLTSASKGPKLSIALVEDELHRLNKNLNEVRVPYELALCAASVSGLISGSTAISSQGTSRKDDSQPKVPETPPTNKWDLYSTQMVTSLGALQGEFTISWNRFLTLHRHWWLVRDATLQFHSEIRKLADWFENVELQLTNGRLTTIVLDDASPYGCFTPEVDDLNYPNVARTQLLLITQLRVHVPVYAKIQVLTERLLEAFTPGEEMNSSELFSDRQALLDARNRIQHEWDQVSLRWTAIVRELAWRRECVIALATGRLSSKTSGFAYKRGVDADFDKVLDDFLRYECPNAESSASSGQWFQLEQLQKWTTETEASLEKIRSDFTISDTESAQELAGTVRDYQMELSRQLLNWMVVCQEPFTNSSVVGQVSKYQNLLTANEREELDTTFHKITTDLFQVCYFTDVYVTCFSYIASLTSSELEWILTAHEHLNSLDDYLALRSIDGASGGGGALQELPVDSLAFITCLKDNLITHENNIEQILTIVNELNQHAGQLALPLNLVDFMVTFHRLTDLRARLMGRLRASGLTVWAALHHLLKQAYNRLKVYRTLKVSSSAVGSSLEPPGSPCPSSGTGSLRSTGQGSANSRFHRSPNQLRPQTREGAVSASATNSLHRQASRLLADLQSYYTVARESFNQWLALEAYILSTYCAVCLKVSQGERSSEGGGVKEERKTPTPVIAPSKALKFTIRRCEDFLTEFHFGQSVLSAIWLELTQLSSEESTAESAKKPENEPNSQDGVPSSVAPGLEPLNYTWYTTIESEIMERIRDLQREHHKRSLAHLLEQSSPPGPTKVNSNGQSPPAVPPKPKMGLVNAASANAATHGPNQNVYDTVADAYTSKGNQDDAPPAPTPTYHRPFESDGPTTPTGSSPANLDSQRQEIDAWLISMEKRFGDFVAEYNHAYVQRRKSSLSRSNGDPGSVSLDSMTNEASLKKQLTIISNYQSELNTFSSKLSLLSNSIDGRIASLAPKGSAISKSTISMPYYDHLVELRKHADEMQIRINDLYLSIKCKLRSLQELFHTSIGNGSAPNSASSRINLMSSGLVNGAGGLDLGIDFHSTAGNGKTAKHTNGHHSSRGGGNSGGANSGGTNSGSDSLPHSGSGSASSQATTVAAISSYALHESAEKRFAKWLVEIEQSLAFIEKRLEAESALNENGGHSKETDDDPLYSNLSEMQQMHMNYFEKIKIMQREIEQKRTDHRILMELLETDVESDPATQQLTRGSRQPEAAGPGGRGDAKRAIDPWLAKFRTRVETLNTRWNSIRLRVLTLRSRLEASSMFAHSLTTTVPATPTSASMYSMNGYGYSGGPQSVMDDTASSIAATMAFSSAATERSSQLLLSLRELVEWIIKRQTEFEQQQQQQHQQQQQQQQAHLQHPQSAAYPNVPLDVANVLTQKAGLVNLRSALSDKRPIIDSTLLACHNLLRRLAMKRSQDVAQCRMSASASVVSGSLAAGGAGSQSHGEGLYDNVGKVAAIRAAKRQEIADLEVSVSREMQRLLEIWNTLQVEVEIRLQRLDDAHLRLTDLQRAMEDLGAKLHEAEYSRAQWLPVGDIPFDTIPQQKAHLKNYSQLYVSTIARDAVHVNELAARLTGRNVPLSHANLKALEEVTTRARLLQVAVDERARELEQATHEHGTAQQHFLTEAVDAPWERAVTANKLPCYINRHTESVQITSPRYTEIMSTLSEFNRVRYAAYRTAMKLRSLQEKLGLEYVTMDILAEAFEQHGLGPNAKPRPTKDGATKKQVTIAQVNGDSSNTEHSSSTPAVSSSLAEDINVDLPYELRLIAVPELVSCLKMIFEMVAATVAAETAASTESETAAANNGSRRSSKAKEKKDRERADKDSSAGSSSSATGPLTFINVPLYVDLCLNWVLALYDAPSRSGYIRQFSFQVAMVLLSKISLEQKYLYLFNLIANDNGHCDERRLGLLIYDCLRLPKLLGEVAAFGGTNIEPSVRSCLEMAGSPPEGITAQQVLTWIRAEPQSLVWLLVLHRLRLAEKSRHPAKCNLCRRYPIEGFRYRCLKCFNFDLCQECFLCDMAVKKHKASHPMQEYCVATTSSEDMRDFTKILRNKFKSGRYFKRNQALGYLPVAALHEGDRLEEAAPGYGYTTFPQTGSYSHNPSSNTTPVHTLPYPIGGHHAARAPSPGALTQRDLDFVLDNAGGRFQATLDRSTLSSVSSMYGRSGGLIRGHPGGQHMSPMMLPRGATVRASPFDRRLPQYHSTPVSPVNHPSRSGFESDSEVHSRLGTYANRLAEAEGGGSSAFNRGQARAASQRAGRGSSSKFDSLPGGSHGPYGSGASGHRSNTLPLHDDHRSDSSMNHYDLVQSPNEVLSKIAADQRSELEQIIQRLEEENKMLMTEYNQLTDDDPIPPLKKKPQPSVQQPQAKPERPSAAAVKSEEECKDSSSDAFSPLYENVINSLERRQKERNQSESSKPKSNGKASSITHYGDSLDSVDSFDDPPSMNVSSSTPIPAYLLEEARQLRQSKTRLETRKVELEKCNTLLESQLTQFKTYISNSGALDAKTKKRLASSIVEMERMLDTPPSGSVPGSPLTVSGNGGAPRSRKSSLVNGEGSSGQPGSPSGATYRQHHPALLHTAADGVNSAVESLVEAFTDPRTGTGSTNGIGGSNFNGN